MQNSRASHCQLMGVAFSPRFFARFPQFASFATIGTLRTGYYEIGKRNSRNFHFRFPLKSEHGIRSSIFVFRFSCDIGKRGKY